MSNFRTSTVTIPRFNIIRPMVDLATAKERLDSYDGFFEDYGLDDYTTIDLETDGLTLLGNKHLRKAAERSSHFKDIPEKLLRNALREAAEESTLEPVTLAVESFDWLPSGGSKLVFAAIVEPRPVVREHRQFVETLGRLARYEIWPSDQSNNIPIAHCTQRMPASVLEEFLHITPLTYPLDVAAFIKT